MYSTLLSTDLLKKPFILFNQILSDGNNDFDINDEQKPLQPSQDWTE